ncbi:MAG: cation diffusion facilitator family transporter [Isosphaeraceae bacterium]
MREIVTPTTPPAPFTLAVVAAVVVVKETMFRKVLDVGQEIGSTAVEADAWHHRSDAITSAAAFVGIAVALWGGPGWESADDWGALVASVVIALNGVRLLRPSVRDLMDRQPEAEVLAKIEQAAAGVEGAHGARCGGTAWAMVDLHVQADPDLSLHLAHILGGKVKGAIRAAVPGVSDVLVHMEPFSDPSPPG